MQFKMSSNCSLKKENNNVKNIKYVYISPKTISNYMSKYINIFYRENKNK